MKRYFIFLKFRNQIYAHSVQFQIKNNLLIGKQLEIHFPSLQQHG